MLLLVLCSFGKCVGKYFPRLNQHREGNLCKSGLGLNNTDPTLCATSHSNGPRPPIDPLWHSGSQVAAAPDLPRFVVSPMSRQSCNQWLARAAVGFEDIQAMREPLL